MLVSWYSVSLKDRPLTGRRTVKPSSPSVYSSAILKTGGLVSVLSYSVS